MLGIIIGNLDILHRLLAADDRLAAASGARWSIARNSRAPSSIWR
jgi:hypothetical protein